MTRTSTFGPHLATPFFRAMKKDLHAARMIVIFAMLLGMIGMGVGRAEAQPTPVEFVR